nr:charged multivesicular body protein 2b-A [Ciona intestinalis]|eukprot:XP_002130869.1 charged multivesicular body protein 2b-A [Ciona intestinalis]
MFGKKKTVEEQLRDQDRQMKRTQRELTRDRTKMEQEEKKLEMEIKKAAKQGNKQACNILAKQLVQMRKQKNRSYATSSTITSVGLKTKGMHANMKMANAMGKTAQTMGKVNKQMDPKRMAQIMQQFEQESTKMEMSEEMINDTMDSVLSEPGDEEEEDQIVSQVLSEIGVSMSGKLSGVNVPSHDVGESNREYDDIEAKLNALRAPAE